MLNKTTSFSDVGEYKQVFRLPVELDMRVLSFVSCNDFEDDDIVWATLLAFSLTCHRFRSLALPRIFAHFQAVSSFEQRDLKEFCQAWVRGDEVAGRCTRYIKSCVFNHGAYLCRPSVINKSLSSLAALPNLTSLDVFFTAIDPLVLEQVLKATQIERLCFAGEVVPDEVGEERFGDEVCRVISTYAKSLKSLKVVTSDLLLNLQTLSQANFRLECFSVLARYFVPIDPSTLRPFLSITPSITTLELNHEVCDPGSLSGLAPDDLPHLHTLVCPISCVPLLIAGSRPITSFHLDLSASHNLELSPTDITNFVDALRRSAGTIRKLKGLPLPLAISAWGIYTPHLEVISVVIPTRPHPGSNPSTDSRMKQDIAYLTENVGGKAGNPDSEKPPLQFKNLLEFEVQPENLSPGGEEQINFENYCIDLQQQRTDVLALAKRFPSLLNAELGLHTRWIRPLDAPDEWKIRVIKRERRMLERMVRNKCTRGSTSWREWDCDGILASILDT